MIRFSGLCVVAGAAVLSCGAASTPVHAQETASVEVVDMHVNIGSADQSIGGSVRAGDSFHIAIDGVGAFEIEPSRVGTNPDRFRVVVHRSEGENGTLRKVEEVSAVRGEVVPLRSIASAAVVIDGVRTAERTVSRVSFPAASSADAGRCCITCSGVTACGCAVLHDCGECCADGCCDVVPVGGGSLARSGSPCDNPIPADERLAMEHLGLAVVRRSAN